MTLNLPRTATAGAAVDTARRGIARLTDLLARYSIDALRISMGVVFLAFGALKFVPGLSPAEGLAVPTVETLTLGIVSGTGALMVTAAVECFIGITLLTGRFVRTGLVVLAGALVGIMSPLVLMFPELFPGGMPTLAAQYVFKDIVLASAALVVAARALGARLTTVPPAEDRPTAERPARPTELAA